MEEIITCLVRTESLNNRVYPLLVFPDHSPLEGKLSSWSPVDGHSPCEKAYVLEHTQDADDEIAEKTMRRYELAFEKAQGPFKLKRLKKFPK